MAVLRNLRIYVAKSNIHPKVHRHLLSILLMGEEEARGYYSLDLPLADVCNLALEVHGRYGQDS